MEINSLKIVRLSVETFEEYNGLLNYLPTMKNKAPSWNLIQFEPHTERRHVVNMVKGFTQFVKLNMLGICWLSKIMIYFGLDVKVELRSDIIVDSLLELSISDDELNTSEESCALNYKSTSDFVIYYKVSSVDNTMQAMKEFFMPILK
ncbi:hypothetical protein RhiirA4_487659, partial [Rhizophagus irregularis]